MYLLNSMAGDEGAGWRKAGRENANRLIELGFYFCSRLTCSRAQDSTSHTVLHAKCSVNHVVARRKVIRPSSGPTGTHPASLRMQRRVCPLERQCL